MQEEWTAAGIHAALAYQSGRAFCVLFVVRNRVTRVVVVEAVVEVEFGGC